MKIASCIDDNCEFCFSSLMEDKHSREAKGPDRNSKATISTQGKTDHKNSCRTTFEAEILFHRGFTSIDRNLVNPAALEKANKHFTESKDQKFIIVRDALSEAEVEALVIRTAVIRNTRKQQKGLQYKEANVVATQADDHIMERKERAEPTLAQLDEKQRPSNPSDASAVGMVGQIPSVESPMSPSEKRVLISPHTEMSSNMTERGIALSKKTNTRRRRRVYSSQNSRSSRTTFKYEGSPSTSTLLSRQSNGSEAPGRWHTGETPSRRPHVASPRRKQSTKPLPSKRSRRSLSSEFREPHTPTMPSQNHQRTPIPRQETARASTRSRKVYGIPEHDEKESNAADTSTPVPTHRIIHQRSHPALRPDDHWSEDPADLSLENTLRVVRKASAWFKKIRGGRRSAPPNESATAASRRGWK
ncbi:hypothetical protein AOQ84DRAFT_171912 [Glonium stellatum]|uniref:DUF8035 domain-containing protein n=1 Tax=Glonium stellatum TaxID=574774 RepID=A0A8E2JW64_9PEZI|nr:hypothetical protein AOQ84DRAFT_171912 [Glonium stellatum]